MAPPSGRKTQQNQETAPPPPVDPLCKHASDVPPNAVGAFTLDGIRITNPSGTFVQSTNSNTAADSHASRQARFLADGGLVVGGNSFSSGGENNNVNTNLVKNILVVNNKTKESANNNTTTTNPLWNGSFLQASSKASAKPIASQFLEDRALTAPAKSPMTKKSEPSLSHFVNKQVCFEHTCRFVAKSNALNAASLTEMTKREVDRSALKFSDNASEILNRGVATQVPSLMRFQHFNLSTSWTDFPRFTTVIPCSKKLLEKVKSNENASFDKEIFARQRAAAFVSALFSLKDYCDRNAIEESFTSSTTSTSSKQQEEQEKEEKEEAKKSEKFAFRRVVRENQEGISSTFRLSVMPSQLTPIPNNNNAEKNENETNEKGFFSCNNIDGLLRSILLHDKGHYWKVDVASSEKQLLQSSNSIFDQFYEASCQLHDTEDRNAVDFAATSRSSCEKMKSLIDIVSGVCTANREALIDAFSCFLSVSFVSNNSNNNNSSSQHKFIGESAFAPISMSINEDDDATITLTWNCAFINDRIAAAASEWITHVADGDHTNTSDSSSAANYYYDLQIPSQRIGADTPFQGDNNLPDQVKDEERGESSSSCAAATTATKTPTPIPQETTTTHHNRRASRPGSSSSGIARTSSATSSPPPPISTTALETKQQQQQQEQQQQTSNNTNTKNIKGRQVEVVRTKPIDLQNQNNTASATMMMMQSAPSSPSKRGIINTPLASTRGGASKTLSAFDNTNKPGGGNSPNNNNNLANNPYSLERVTITIPDPVPSIPTLLQAWVPRTISLPKIEPVFVTCYDFKLKLREPRSLYFAAALTLWDDRCLTPPDVVCWNRSCTGVEPLLSLCRSHEIDQFLQAARTAGQPSLGPHHHDLFVLFQKAVDSLDNNQMQTTKSSNNNSPFISVMHSMANLKMLDVKNSSKETLNRFANPIIVVSNGSLSSSNNSNNDNNKFFSPLTPPPGNLLENISKRNSFELLFNVGERHNNKHDEEDSDYYEVSCTFTAPFNNNNNSEATSNDDTEGNVPPPANNNNNIQQICRWIEGFATVIDSYSSQV